MDGEIGDRLVVLGRRVGERFQDGEITEVLTTNGRHYRVRWSDGHESIIYPGPDVTIRSSSEPRLERRTLAVDLRLSEDRDHCRATATMMTTAGTFTGAGEARRHPNDPEVPVIGEEIAVVRALRELADNLERAATRAMTSPVDRSLHLVS